MEYFAMLFMRTTLSLKKSIQTLLKRIYRAVPLMKRWLHLHSHLSATKPPLEFRPLQYTGLGQWDIQVMASTSCYQHKNQETIDFKEWKSILFKPSRGP